MESTNQLVRTTKLILQGQHTRSISVAKKWIPLKVLFTISFKRYKTLKNKMNQRYIRQRNYNILLKESQGKLLLL